MSRRLICDHCDGDITGEPFELSYPVDASDDDDDDEFVPLTERADFCSIACLTAWAMAHTLDGGD